MKRSGFLLLIISIIPLCLYSQDNQSIHELGISFSSTSSFGIKYKFGNDNLLYRISLLSINGSTTNNPTSNSTGLGFSIGIEKIKSIKGKLNYYYGIDLIESYSNVNNFSTSPGTSALIINSKIGAVLGLLYKINDDFNVSFEIIPGLSYAYAKNSNSPSRHTYSFSGSTSGANITIAYRF